ncbi:hypothetical protein K5I29_11520 [Flavobacterium agricola]|uniref:Uncharacterized protein n=1 Tax=Flavobacterium agricola TaxID=2870839 RepID=A0ABY6M045_9FLAO|nr:hypothetical protein [Flavobacterium agricola]UYW01095.1 hypothetical protein K5I29_11520 [Flavobacterium agricola]
MSNLKNLDRLFKEKFKDFEVNAPQNSWSNISNAMAPKAAFSITSYLQTYKYQIAAVVTVTMVVGYLFVNNLAEQKRDFIAPAPIVMEQAIEATLPDYLGKSLDIKPEAPAGVFDKEEKTIRTAKTNKKVTLLQNTTLVNAETKVEKALPTKANVFRADKNNTAKKVTTTTLTSEQIEKYINSVSDSSSLISTNVEKQDSLIVL